jgi:hypothetical protein
MCHCSLLSNQVGASFEMSVTSLLWKTQVCSGFNVDVNWFGARNDIDNLVKCTEVPIFFLWLFK